MDLYLLRAALSSALVALDFDGTLAPISPHPDDARPLAGIHQILRDVRATGATLAVVTGRSVASLLRISSLRLPYQASSSTARTAPKGGRRVNSALRLPHLAWTSSA